MSVAWVLLVGVGAALIALSVLTLTLRHKRQGLGRDAASGHLETLRSQRGHVERLANRLEHEQVSNHFRIRVERALRGQR